MSTTATPEDIANVCKLPTPPKADAPIGEPIEPVAWRWSESGGKNWFDWTTDWTHHDKAKRMGFPIQYATPIAAPAAQPGVMPAGWPAGLLERVKSAAQRVQDNRAPRSIPADPRDVDLVLAEVQMLLEGKAPPFWLDAIPSAAQPATSSEAAPASVVAADQEPFWHAVVSDEAPVINKAIRRADVAEEYAQNCRENGYQRVEVVPLYRAAPSAAQPAAPTMEAAEPQLQELAAKIKRLGLEIFDGPECPQMVRDAIEWFAAELSVSKLAAPAGESNERAASGQDEGNGNG